MTSPLVSVVTPTRNMADRLQRCIDSVRSQGWPVEHIVVDGASTDDTVALLEATSGVRWISEPDRGQSDAINKGFRMATGDVLGWLNSDDELAEGAIKQIMRAFERRPGAGVVYGDIEVVEAGRRERVRPRGAMTARELWRGNVISQPGTFWTRAAWEEVGEIDESFHLTMDFELWLRFARAGIEAVYVPEVLARFEVHEASKTGSETRWAFAEEESRALRKHGDAHGAAMAIDRWYWNDVMDRTLNALDAGDHHTARSIAREALPRLHPVGSRVRWFLVLAGRAPSVARMAGRWRR